MPIKKRGSFDLEAGIIATTKERLSKFLSNEELEETEVYIQDGKIGFNAKSNILDKIENEFGIPAERR
ncbi:MULTISPECIES: hypothetical protein [Vibrio]|uniref:hypothetical protein n=1 Tax=Vibrio TaxID=662 RepID=UPI0005F1F420|nr:hypothetical protein [Vibrio vulnificus]EGQ9440951.1 hypothetical protein [Vibrio cholerae]ELP1878858.1 hypothetical protein [Vibrio vulnificus]ELX4200067.1 hypothetical protein [Vibrio vulnificus]MCG6303686.1 hypothetical protein [Vibrio vulnificus]RZR20913.1 hypothetical protein D8T63_22145 [Vibrio vulnificus]